MTGTAARADAEGSGLGGPQGSRNPYSNQEVGVAGWDRGNPAMGLPGDGVSSQHILIICYCSLSESCPTLFYPMDAAHQASLFLLFLSLIKLMSTESGMPPTNISSAAFNFSQRQGLFQ